MIEAVIFDIDNTVMDFMRMKRAAVDAAADAMIDSGLKTPKAALVDKIFSVYWREGIEDQNIFDKVLSGEMGQVDYKILSAGIVGYRRAKDAATTLYPHVGITMTELIKMGVRLGVVSDAPRLPVWLRITTLGLQHYFDHVVTYDDTGERKPSPKPFMRALDFLKVAPEKSLMIGDWAERDIAGAKKLGMKTVWARYGNQFDNVRSGADYEIDDVYELVDIVRKLNTPCNC
ncbi:MAG: HAD-IA family hydrolase [Elusimicrobiales bacterium]